MLTTIEDIAQDFVNLLHPSDVKDIADDFSSYEPLIRSLTTTGIMREIRNRYNLWTDNPLTEKWRTDEASHDIRDGVDYSEDHPDNISSDIYDRIVELAKERSV